MFPASLLYLLIQALAILSTMLTALTGMTYTAVCSLDAVECHIAGPSGPVYQYEIDWSWEGQHTPPTCYSVEECIRVNGVMTGTQHTVAVDAAPRPHSAYEESNY